MKLSIGGCWPLAGLGVAPVRPYALLGERLKQAVESVMTLKA
ncbi:hypothetical protein [Halomonas sp. G11]|nr:hypothetical protein [Halomonas sp. G11]